MSYFSSGVGTSPGSSPFSLKKLDNIRVSIQVRRPLDHEAPGGPVHLLCIHATDAGLVMPAGRRKRQAELYDQQNFTVAYVEVHIVDINDNKPVFSEKIVKTGVVYNLSAIFENCCRNKYIYICKAKVKMYNCLFL